MGVWIETVNTTISRLRLEVTPCVGVWIETYKAQFFDNTLQSHPAWVCGLKQRIREMLSTGA